MTRVRHLLAGVLLGAAFLADPAAAHVGSLGEVANASVPFWFVATTGGAVIGVSFLFATLVTDDAVIEAVNGWRRRLPLGGVGAATWGVRAAAVAVLAVVVVSGLVGPRAATANVAVLVVWAGWWAGYTMSVYLVGNTWPAINPWRAAAALLPARSEYPERLGAWPSVAGLLALVWLEVVSPVARDPRLLAGVVAAYSLVTLAGAGLYGDAWFRNVDPIAGVFRVYGRMAPVQRGEDGIEVAVPGAALTTGGTDGLDGTAFVIALLWVTTYDGLVSTPLWAAAVGPLVRAGVPALAVYLVAVVAGFWLFFRVYRAAARRSRRTADSYASAAFVRDWFAPALVPIAAGYHLAHYLGYFLALSPALAAVAASPFAVPADLQVLVLPAWFSALQLVFVVLGHVLAVWVAHALAFELFPGRLAPIRSQYPFVLVMVFYTMTSLWIVAQPASAPPYV